MRRNAKYKGTVIAEDSKKTPGVELGVFIQEKRF